MATPPAAGRRAGSAADPAGAGRDGDAKGSGGAAAAAAATETAASPPLRRRRRPAAAEGAAPQGGRCPRLGAL